MARRIKIGGRLESVETGNIVAGANQIIDDAKNKKQSDINGDVDAELVRLDETKQGNLTFDNAPTEDSNNPVKSGGVYAADKLLSDAIEAILLLIPSAASALNKLVDMQTMNSSIATATATFRGTYNVVSDLELAYNATHEQIAAKLDEVITTADNNDYAFVQIPVSATSQDIAKTERYKFNGTNWLFEYDLNNSGFTQGQWNAINSGVTSLLVSKLSDLPTNAELTNQLAGKQDNLTFDNVPMAGSPNPVKSGGVYARNNEIVALINALDAAKQDVLTFDNAPVEGSPNPVKSGGVYTAISAVQAAIVALDAEKQNVLTFDSTPTLGSPNPVTSSGIKTQLNRIDGDIVTLNNLYQALTQSALVVVAPADTWPVASPDEYTIYRVVDRTNTPPQYYSDYMWNGTTMVLMAKYDNAIDDVPTAGSNNLVKSGGVFQSSLEIKKQINKIHFEGIDSKEEKITIKDNKEKLKYTEITFNGSDDQKEEIILSDKRGVDFTKISFSNSSDESEEIQIIDKNNYIFGLSKKGIRANGLFAIDGNPLDKSVFSSISMIQKLGVCGDSYAQGSVVLSNPDRFFTREDLSWGKVLGRMYGIDVTLFAQGGETVATYIETSTCLPKLLNTEAQELYAISLGHNDMYHGTPVGNINTRGTFLGDYAYIISQIQQHAPHAMIVLLQQSRPYCDYPSGPQLNGAIALLGQEFSIPVFNPEDDEYLSSDAWVETMSRNHPVFAGYAGLAFAFARQFAYHTVKDWDYFMRFGTDLI